MTDEMMTVEEVIELLKNKRMEINYMVNGTTQFSKALDMAIKALEQESITWIVGKDNCQVAVKNMPVDKMQKICAIIGEEEQQPHKAEFVPSRDGYEGHVTCSNCFKIYDWDSEAQYFNYCPNCGADMRENKEIESEQLIDELSKMPPTVIATAYLHAINYTLYGVDVTEKWLTATQNASTLEKAYRKGYHDGIKYGVEHTELE